MLNMEQIHKLIELSNKTDKTCGVNQRKSKVFGKVVEEVGEFSRAIHQPERCDENFFKEGADVLISVFDAILVNAATSDLGISKEMSAQILMKEISESLNKWENKI